MYTSRSETKSLIHSISDSRPGFFRRTSDRFIRVASWLKKQGPDYDNEWREEQLRHCTDVIVNSTLCSDEKSTKVYFPHHIAQKIADFTVPNVERKTLV